MRINEFASAEEQLALWKLVSNNVWTALSTQAEQQARANAVGAQQSQTKKSTSSKRAIRKAPYVPQSRSHASPVHPIQAKTKVNIPQKQTTTGSMQKHWGATKLQARTTQPPKQFTRGITQQRQRVPNPQVTPSQVQQPQHKPLNPLQMRLQR